MNLKNKTKKELETMVFDLISQRMNGKISPGEYYSRMDLILDEMKRFIRTEKEKQSINNAYDRAMRGV